MLIDTIGLMTLHVTKFIIYNRKIYEIDYKFKRSIDTQPKPYDADSHK